MAHDHDPGRTSRRRQTAIAAGVALAVPAIAVPMVFAARDRPAASPAPPVAAAPPSVPVIRPSPVTVAPRLRSTPPSWADAPKGMPDSHGCPVTADRLLAALRDSEAYGSLAPTTALNGIDCYGGYALGITDPVGADPATVVFRYREPTNSWTPLAGGTSGQCDGVVPEVVRAHLEHCS
ncbi:hypothetical protein [Actinoplanes sp. NPDC026623]|uniref:hypothetical protein n=1 Tax=Actinoplanes sp. NPDC026623 TaxID=3155610 RepID=UPI0033E67FA4